VPPAPAVIAALEDDINTPQALGELAAIAREINRLDGADAKRALAEQLRASAWYLGLLAADPLEWFAGVADGDAIDAAEIEGLLAQRVALRAARDFAGADRIRDELAARDIAIEDGPEGSRWRRIR
jgi:cysteinyl-tRNA synthetase